MQAHFLYTPWNSERDLRSKDLFLKEVILLIKLMKVEHRAPCKQIFCPYIHPRPSESIMLHIKLIEVEQRAPCKHIYYVLTNTLDPLGEIKGHYF